MNIKCGIGFDAHRFEKNRKLTIGGVEIPYEMGLEGHSDADVLAHAIIDSLAGPALGKDVGGLFPDSDPKYKNISSLLLLQETCLRIEALGWRISHVDAEIVAQSPKMAPYIPEMRKVLAKTMKTLESEITVKATTTERMGFAGREEGIAAFASSLIINEGRPRE